MSRDQRQQKSERGRKARETALAEAAEVAAKTEHLGNGLEKLSDVGKELKLGIARFRLPSSSSTLTTYDTGLRTLATGLTPSISIQKVAVAQNGSTINGYLNGSLTNDSPQTAHAYIIGPIGIGVSSSIYQLFGTIRNVRIYPTALSAAQLQAMTT